MIVVTADRFAVLLQTLRLSQGLFKPLILASPGLSLINRTQAPNTAAANGSSNLNLHADVQPLLMDTINEPSCNAEPYDVPNIDDQTFSPFDQTEATVFRYRQQQSVNLGSWYAFPTLCLILLCSE